MAVILRKVWDSVLGFSSSTSASNTLDLGAEEEVVHFSSTGFFDALPADVFMQIMRFAGPRDAARACSVCRSWRHMASDNKLWIFFLQCGKEPWDSVLYAETHLRCGSRSMLYLNHVPHMSFKGIYGQREKVPGAIIIDGGSGYCKYGWSKYTSPSGWCATFMEFGNIESPMYSRLRHFFFTIYSRMQVKPSSQPVVVSLPICHFDDTESAQSSRKQLWECIHSVLFDLNVPAVCAIDQAILALYAAKRTSGIVVNIGFHITSIVPIFRGQVMHDVGVEVIGQGALKLTGFLRDQMQRKNINFESLYTVRTLKEKLCYVAVDYEAELQKNTEASIEVAGEGWFTLSKERFQTGEILFQPQMGGTGEMSLHSAIARCLDHCISSIVSSDDGWFKTIILSGGTSCLPGLPERLTKEIVKLFPPSISKGIKVISPPFGADSAWFGAKIVSNVSTFEETWCTTKKQFRQKFPRSKSYIGS